MKSEVATLKIKLTDADSKHYAKLREIAEDKGLSAVGETYTMFEGDYIDVILTLNKLTDEKWLKNRVHSVNINIDNQNIEIIDKLHRFDGLFVLFGRDQKEYLLSLIA